MKSGKIEVLIFADWFCPAYKAGGPVKSLQALVLALSDRFYFRIVCRDRDLGESGQFNGIVSDEWVQWSDSVSVLYCSPERTRIGMIKSILENTPSSIIYINGIYSLYFSVLPLILSRIVARNKAIVVSPRGMLSSGALEIKPMRKKMFLCAMRFFGFYRQVNFLVSGKPEILEAEKIGINPKRITSLRNLAVFNETEFSITEKQTGQLKLYFLGRISKVKNLLFAIKVLQLFRDGNIEFDIYGSIEDPEYWEQCLKEISLCSDNVVMKYKGEIANSDDKNYLLRDYHALFLPSANENFGHSIVEAFSMSKPVLISNKTPWQQLRERNLGFEISLDNPNEFCDAIIAMLKWDQRSYSEICENVKQFFESEFNQSALISDFTNFFKSLVNHGSKS